MSEISVNSLRLPRLHTGQWRNRLARRGLHRLLEHLQTGSLSLHEAGLSHQFGRPGTGAGPHAEVHIHDPVAYREVLTGGSLGAGEAYMLGHWSSPGLVDVIRLFTANMATLDAMDSRSSLVRRLGLAMRHAFNNNSPAGSQRNISAHYDLGNDFFALFLDPSMMYSAAVFPRAEASLEEASTHKMKLLCEQLQLREGDHLLEIGTGWGGMAIYAARHYGARVTTTTLSREQYRYSRERVRQAGLEHRVSVLCQDYRQLEGHYDKLVSIEMIEAVGHQYYPEYFRKCSALLQPGGLMAIQAITVGDQRYEQARDAVDFIKRYVFPGGCLPSVEVISKHLRQDTDMQMIHLLDITGDYANTLAHWRERFFEQLGEVRRQGFDETFERMWEFYLCYCEGGFRERVIGTVQLTFAKPGWRPAP